MAQARPLAVMRVLVADGSVVVRRVVVRALAHAPGVAVVGTARDGHSTLAKVTSLQPDLLVLDLDMPDMDGHGTLAEIRRRHPRLPVIIYGRYATATAAAALDALALGAIHFALKASPDGVGLAEESVRVELMPLILALVSPSDRPVIPVSSLPASRAAPAAIVVAVSTGGPNALAEVISGLPSDLRVPVLVVQHMPPLFTAALAERLDRVSAVSVVEAAAGDEVVAGRVYIAPGGHHMALSRTGGGVRVVVHDGPAENSCRPAADVLFRAAVDVYGAHVLAVVMTGMGHDGLSGARAVRDAGGTVIAQSESSCVIASMPRAIASAGLADAVVPLDELSGVLTRRVAERP